MHAKKEENEITKVTRNEGNVIPNSNFFNSKIISNRKKMNPGSVKYYR